MVIRGNRITVHSSVFSTVVRYSELYRAGFVVDSSAQGQVITAFQAH